MKWQPIETAPKDGDFILVKWKRESRADYLPIIDVSKPQYIHKNMDAATHWMPLPPPPKEEVE